MAVPFIWLSLVDVCKKNHTRSSFTMSVTGSRPTLSPKSVLQDRDMVFSQAAISPGQGSVFIDENMIVTKASITFSAQAVSTDSSVDVTKADITANAQMIVTNLGMDITQTDITPTMSTIDLDVVT